LLDANKIISERYKKALEDYCRYEDSATMWRLLELKRIQFLLEGKKVMFEYEDVRPVVVKDLQNIRSDKEVEIEDEM